MTVSGLACKLNTLERAHENANSLCSLPLIESLSLLLRSKQKILLANSRQNEISSHQNVHRQASISHLARQQPHITAK